jgi:hypothetical protein
MVQPTFAERILALKDIAGQLRSFAETIALEVQHMEAVQSRFQHRVSKRAESKKSQKS